MHRLRSLDQHIADESRPLRQRHERGRGLLGDNAIPKASEAGPSSTSLLDAAVKAGDPGEEGAEADHRYLRRISSTRAGSIG